MSDTSRVVHASFQHWSQRLLAISLLVLLAAPVSAGTGEKSDTAVPPRTEAVSAAAKAAETVSREPAPALEEPSRSIFEGTDLGRMLRRDVKGTPIVRLPGGASMVNLNGGFRSVLVARTDEKGKAVLSCVISESAARAILEPDANGGHADQKEP